MFTLQVVRSAERATVGGPHSGSVLVGRAGAEAADADPTAGETRLSIDLGVVSRRHCSISRVGGDVVVVDLDSANGTFVGRGSSVHHVTSEPFVLRAGDVISTAGGAAPMVTVAEATS
jgi:pSer/pThr/pTyr-binding forkhead associated (FHA) protein